MVPTKNIELLGLPCTGKTYYAEANYSVSSMVYVDRIGEFKKILFILKGVLKNPQIFGSVFIISMHTRRADILCQVKGVLRFFIRVEEISNMKRTHSLVVEEGVLQALWGVLFLAPVCEATISRAGNIIDLLYKKNLVFRSVYLSCTDDVLLERTIKRKKKTRFSEKWGKDGFQIDDPYFKSGKNWMALILKLVNRRKF